MKTDLPQIRAAFVTRHENWPWRRQLPAGQDIFDGVHFFAPVADADVVFVYDDLLDSKLEIPAQTLTAFVCSEPKNVKRYQPEFLAQFDLVITTDRETPHPNRLFIQAGLPWHVGSMAEGGSLLESPMRFEEFQLHDPAKKRLVSVASSNKSFTSEHRARLAFVSKLKDALGDRIDVFGRGIVDFDDKRDILDSYRYHIALENCATKDYWTEKLADSFLTLTFPIYHGCPNIDDYFPSGAFQKIDIYRPDEAIEIIRAVIDSNLAEQSRKHLLEARRRVMYEHNVFGMLARVARDLLAQEVNPNRKRARTLRPERHFMPFATKVNLWLRYQVERQPVLQSYIRLIKLRARSLKSKANHFYCLLTDELYRSQQHWVERDRSNDIRFQYNLPVGAKILDIGGRTRDFAAHFINLYNAKVKIFETERHFSGDERARVNREGLPDKDEVVEFDLDADASGVFGTSDGQKVKVALWDVERFLSECGTDEWHLAKLNIEGGEYALLNRLIDTGRIASIQYLQVQFHLHVPNARQQYRDLAKRLRRTHRLQWRYPFVWESWIRREDVSASHDGR